MKQLDPKQVDSVAGSAADPRQSDYQVAPEAQANEPVIDHDPAPLPQ
ncbi:MAG TPA: hypothetical protein VNU21_17910 [Usitatibacter sp.]|jgi:hypothetical protein|nr:hypothetical protein [Usitatibacter sp.]